MQHYDYLLLLFALFFVPRLLQRLRIPTAITSFAIGVVCALETSVFLEDPAVKLLATLGIVSLFLFAGLDVELSELRANAGVLLQHVFLQVLSLAWVAVAVAWWFDLEARPATLVALALLTPSAGFILDSLEGLRLPAAARFWVKSKAIATELVALGVLFVTLRSSSTVQLGLSIAVLVAMLALLPFVFRLFAKFLVPHAPKSEFAFLLMTALGCALITHELGVYYLVGAFVVGMAARRLRDRIPNLASETMLTSVESLASLLVPFYFFRAGSGVRVEDLGLEALATGAVFAAVGISLRLFTVWLHRRVVFGESLGEALRIGTPMLPTLVFTLVIAGILREQFEIPAAIFGGLVVYTIATSLIPGFALRTQLPELEDELMLGPAPTEVPVVPIGPGEGVASASERSREAL
jgi:Kef-type K+ transport system membrane component KefB